jgi:hypothetical protein
MHEVPRTASVPRGQASWVIQVLRRFLGLGTQNLGGYGSKEAFLAKNQGPRFFPPKFEYMCMRWVFAPYFVANISCGTGIFGEVVSIAY